jgi:RNA polymerase sigma-70 factor, ECF subfamily
VRLQTRYSAAGVGTALPASTLLESPETLPESEAAPEVVKPRALSDGRIRSAIDDHFGMVWRVARRAGLGREDAEDAAQHAFFVLSQRLDDVPKRAETAFLITTVLRVARDLRVRKWNTAVDRGLDADERPTQAPSPEDEVDRQRALAVLNESLRALDEAERMVFVLIEIEQLSRTEAAAALDIPEGTVASRLRKARAGVEAAFARSFRPRKERR